MVGVISLWVVGWFGGGCNVMMRKSTRTGLTKKNDAHQLFPTSFPFFPILLPFFRLSLLVFL